MTNELLAEVSILREKVEKYEKAIEDIKTELIEIRNHPDLPNAEYRTIWKCLDIIDKHISGKESE